MEGSLFPVRDQRIVHDAVFCGHEGRIAGKKLSGAAKDSFTKKCVQDATGT
jgi:hypothetical protein